MLVVIALVAVAQLAPTDALEEEVSALQAEGTAHLRAKRWGRALERYRAALDILTQLDDRGADVAALMYLSGYCLEKSGDPAAALERYERALRVGPEPELQAKLAKRIATVQAARDEALSTQVALSPPAPSVADTTAPWAATVSSFALLAGSAVAYGVAHVHRADANDAYDRFYAAAIVGEPSADLRGQVEDADRAALLSRDVAYGLAAGRAAAAVVAVVLWALVDSPKDAPVALGPGGVAW